MNIKIYNNDLPSDLDLSGEKVVALDNEALGLVLGRDPLTLVQIGLKNNNFYLVKLNRETYEAPNLKRFLSPHVIKINKNSKGDGFKDFVYWLQEDLNSVNKLVLDNLTNTSSLISELSNHIINSGGKRIRPLLTLAIAKLCGYSGSRHIILASVIEYIHTATLLHDDVVDNSKKRRGKKTANFLWGNKSSILVGDFLLSKAFRILISDGSLKCLSRGLGDVYKRQELFSAACQLSSEISEISTEIKNSLKDFGIHLGVCFQIIDDTLDYFSEEKVFGKEIGNDFNEGKMTLPLILLYKRSNDKEKQLLKYLVNKEKLNRNDFSHVIEKMNKYNVKNDCLDKAKHFSVMAKDSLGLLPKSEGKVKIINLIDSLLSRKK